MVGRYAVGQVVRVALLLHVWSAWLADGQHASRLRQRSSAVVVLQQFLISRVAAVVALVGGNMLAVAGKLHSGQFGVVEHRLITKTCQRLNGPNAFRVVLQSEVDGGLVGEDAFGFDGLVVLIDLHRCHVLCLDVAGGQVVASAQHVEVFDVEFVDGLAIVGDGAR